MTTGDSPFDKVLDFPFGELLIRSDVRTMSQQVLGIDYAVLKTFLYPRPPYKTFFIKKRNGNLRIIHEPRRKLKLVQERLLAYLYERSGVAKPCVHGFTPNRSVVTNARKHCSPRTRRLLNFDIEDFFPSITFYRVRGLFQKQPFGFSHETATVLAQLCTFDGVLPQGAPTSPIISNLICRSLDRDLMALAKRHQATYTRYADDITFSFSKNWVPGSICRIDGTKIMAGDALAEVIESHSFRINPSKSRVSTRRDRLEVTGVTINEFPNVRRAFIDRIRGGLHAWEKYGYLHAQEAWEARVSETATGEYEKRIWKRQTRGGQVPGLANVLWGKLLYVHMVRGADDPLYTRLAERYNALCSIEKAKGEISFPSLPVEPIVRTTEDVDDAVFVIEWSGDVRLPDGTLESVYGQGTAFAYSDVGLITCDHVFRFACPIENGKEIVIDVQSGDVANLEMVALKPTTRESWPVKIVRRDAGYDLAVVRFDGRAPPTHRRFGVMKESIPIGAEGYLIGFPNHSPGKQANRLEAKVLNRATRSALKRFDITGSIRKGNSGGPFVDRQFRLAGIAQQGATQDSGNDECLCYSELESWIAEWKAAP